MIILRADFDPKDGINDPSDLPTLVDESMIMIHRSSVLFILTATLGLLPMAAAQDIVAHRGASYDAPENTLAAFRLAWEKNADVIEGDFYLTADGRIVCHHDATTEKTADTNLVIANSTLEELQKLDVGSWKDPEYQGERIPTLEEVLATVPDGKRILIEVKCGPEITEALKTIIDECDLSDDQIAIIAFDDRVVASCKEAMPHIKAFWLTSFKEDETNGRFTPSINQILDTLKRCKADGLDCKANLQVLSSDFVAKLRSEGFEFHCWTVNDPALANDLKSLGVDSITTDRPQWLRERIQ